MGKPAAGPGDLSIRGDHAVAERFLDPRLNPGWDGGVGAVDADGTWLFRTPGRDHEVILAPERRQ